MTFSGIALYFFSATEKNVTGVSSFVSSGGNSIKALSINPSSSISGSVSVDSSAKYLYVAATTGNGKVSVIMYQLGTSQGGGSSGQINNGTQVGTDDIGLTNKDEGKGSGFGDYDLGQMILIILVIVLIVSCALIITQKIVDYKKRLY